MKRTRIVLATVLLVLFAIGIASAVTGEPSVNFSASDVSGPYPFSVTFTGQAINMSQPFSYHWDFGDGTGAEKVSVSTISPITHTYLHPGKYTVRLAVYDIGFPITTWVSTTKTEYITVTHVKPTAGFTFTPPGGSSPVEVQFTDTTTGFEPDLLWDFGDGTSTTTDQNPVHTFTATDHTETYTITLTATNDGGSDTYTDTITILPPKPEADFEALSTTTGPVPLAVQFNDTSVGVGITTYLWDFGDGGSSGIRTPLHAYGSIGVYNVSLQVTSPSGSDTKTKIGFVNVTNVVGPVVCPTPELPIKPVASGSCTPRTGNLPIAVTCTDTSTNNPTNWSWRLAGEGGVYASNAQNPAFILPTNVPGQTDTYTLTLIARNGAGESHELAYHGYASYYTPLSIPTPSTNPASVGIYKDGTWYLDLNANGVWDGTTTDRLVTQFGMSGWEPVKGDWNGNGITKIGIYKDGVWYLDMDGSGSWNSGDAVYSFGSPGWTPVVSDWTGTGTTKIGIYQDGTWYLDLNANGIWDGASTDRYVTQFGMSGWEPVPGKWS